MTHISPIQQRFNITFGKFDALKYTGNLDIAKVWERVLRRADLPLLYTQGFNTRPRIALASALPLGITSECEILDISLREVIPSAEGIPALLESVSPDGLKVFKITEVPINMPALQTLVTGAEYRFTFIDAVDDLQERVEQIINAETLIKMKEKPRKKGKRRRSVMDLRPMIHDLGIDENGNLVASIASGELYGNLRPDDLLEAMGLGNSPVRAHRVQLIMLDEYQHYLAELG